MTFRTWKKARSIEVGELARMMRSEAEESSRLAVTTKLPIDQHFHRQRKAE
jgi:hypothetical protein